MLDQMSSGRFQSGSAAACRATRLKPMASIHQDEAMYHEAFQVARRA